MIHNNVIGRAKNSKISGCSAVGSALALGARCREFESPHSDQPIQYHHYHTSKDGIVYFLKPENQQQALFNPVEEESSVKLVVL